MSARRHSRALFQPEPAGEPVDGAHVPVQPFPHAGHEIFFGNKEDYLKSQSYQIFMDKGGEQ